MKSILFSCCLVWSLADQVFSQDTLKIIGRSHLSLVEALQYHDHYITYQLHHQPINERPRKLKYDLLESIHLERAPHPFLIQGKPHKIWIKKPNQKLSKKLLLHSVSEQYVFTIFPNHELGISLLNDIEILKLQKRKGLAYSLIGAGLGLTAGLLVSDSGVYVPAKTCPNTNPNQHRRTITFFFPTLCIPYDSFREGDNRFEYAFFGMLIGGITGNIMSNFFYKKLYPSKDTKQKIMEHLKRHAMGYSEMLKSAKK